MGGEVPLGQAGDVLQEQEIGALAGRERGQDRESRGLVKEPVETGDLLEGGRAHGASSVARASDSSASGGRVRASCQ
jgi:hypothetical protein